MESFNNIYAEHLCSSCVHRNDGKHTCTVCYDGNLFENKYQAERERFIMNIIENLKRDIHNLAGRMGLRVRTGYSPDRKRLNCRFYRVGSYDLSNSYDICVDPSYIHTDAIQILKNRLNEKFGFYGHAPRIMRTSLPKIIKVIFNDPATIVFWIDGTKTVVKAQEGDKFDPEKGLAMAISKKALGNEGSYYNEISKWIIGYGLAKYNEAIKEREAESQTDYSDVLEERESDSSEPSTPSLYW